MQRWVIGVDPGATTGISVHHGARRPTWCGPMRNPDWRKIVAFLEQGVVPWRGKLPMVVDWPAWDADVERILVVEDQHVGRFPNAVIPLTARRVAWEILAAERGWAVLRVSSGTFRRRVIGAHCKGMSTDEFKREAIQTVKMEMGLELTHDVAEAVCMGILGATLLAPELAQYAVEPGTITAMGRTNSGAPKRRTGRTR